MSTEQQSKPWYYSRTIYLGVALALLPIAEYLAQVLPEVVPVRYVGLGMALLGALVAGLRWVTKLPLGGKAPIPRGSIPLPVLLLLAVGLGAGCGTSTAAKLSLVATGTNALWTRGYPVIDATCRAEAQKCVKPGEAVPLEACPGAKKCLDALKLFQRSLDTADRAVLVGLPLAAADDKSAAVYLTAALTAYNQAMAAAIQWGLAPGGK